MQAETLALTFRTLAPPSRSGQLSAWGCTDAPLGLAPRPSAHEGVGGSGPCGVRRGGAVLRATRGRAAHRGRAAGLRRCGVRVRDPRQVGGGGRPDAWQQVLQHLGKHVAPLARLGGVNGSGVGVSGDGMGVLVGASEEGLQGRTAAPSGPGSALIAREGSRAQEGRAPRAVSGPLCRCRTAELSRV
jgi:hypothetical protein